MRDDVRDTLNRISAKYVDGLEADTRRRVVTAALEARAHSRTSWVGSLWRLAPQVAVTGAILLFLATPVLYMNEVGSPQAPSAIRDLEVTNQGGRVVLTWSDGGSPRRVVRATSREELEALDRIPGEVVTGERWVDNRPGTSTIVYYVVE